MSDLHDHVSDQLRDRLHGQVEAYDPESEVHLSGYSSSLATYLLAAGTAVAAARAAGREAPQRYAPTDIVLGGLAVFRFSRLVARGSVASPVRAPFTRFEGAAGSAEHFESARGHGVRRTVGELLTCPFCVGVWVATAYVGGLGVSPRAARSWAATFAVVGVSDFLQHGYDRLRRT